MGTGIDLVKRRNYAVASLIEQINLMQRENPHAFVRKKDQTETKLGVNGMWEVACLCAYALQGQVRVCMSVSPFLDCIWASLAVSGMFFFSPTPHELMNCALWLVISLTLRGKKWQSGIKVTWSAMWESALTISSF